MQIRMIAETFVFAFQHFHEHISVEHDEKPSHTESVDGGPRYDRMNNEYLISPIESSVN